MCECGVVVLAAIVLGLTLGAFAGLIIFHVISAHFWE